MARVAPSLDREDDLIPKPESSPGRDSPESMLNPVQALQLVANYWTPLFKVVGAEEIKKRLQAQWSVSPFSWMKWTSGVGA